MKRNTTKEIILNKHENNAVEYKFTRNHVNVAENNMTLLRIHLEEDQWSLIRTQDAWVKS